MKAVELPTLLTTLEAMSKKTGHGLSYEINSTLYEVKNLHKEWNDRVNMCKETYVESDKEGNPIQFVVRDGVIVTEDGILCVTSEGTIYKKTELKEGDQKATRIDPVKLNDLIIELSKYENEEVELKSPKFDQDKFKKACENGVFDGIEFYSLFGVIV